MNKRNAASAACLAAMSLLAFAGCSGGSGGSDDGAIKIGVITSESGSGAAIGASELKGYQAAVKAINASGGIEGKQLQLVTMDDQSADATAVNDLRQLVSSDHVVAVLGPGGTSTATAAASAADSLGVPMIAFPSTEGETWEGPKVAKWAFGIAASGTSIGEACFNMYRDWASARQQSVGTVAIGAETDNAAPEYAEGVTTAAQSAGARIVTSQTWPADVSDLTPQMTNMRSAKADLNVISAYNDSDVQAARAMGQLGMSADNFLQCSSIVLSDYVNAVGSEADGMKFMALGVDDPAGLPASFPLASQIKQFRADFTKAFPGEQPDRFAAGTYQTVMMLKQAIRSGGSTSADDIRGALEKLNNYKGPYTIVSYTSERHRPSAQDYAKSSVLLSYGAGGFTDVSAANGS